MNHGSFPPPSPPHHQQHQMSLQCLDGADDDDEDEECQTSVGSDASKGKAKMEEGGGRVRRDDVMLRKGPWMQEEDEILVEYVKKNGPRDWSSIRQRGLLPRTGKSCRLRWVNKLKPNLKSGCKFSAEEERIVIEMQGEIGNKWARIATFLPGRTDNDVKNFWSTRQKRLARLLKTPLTRRSSPVKKITTVSHQTLPDFRPVVCREVIPFQEEPTPLQCRESSFINFSPNSTQMVHRTPFIGQHRGTSLEARSTGPFIGQHRGTSLEPRSTGSKQYLPSTPQYSFINYPQNSTQMVHRSPLIGQHRNTSLLEPDNVERKQCLPLNSQYRDNSLMNFRQDSPQMLQMTPLISPQSSVFLQESDDTERKPCLPANVEPLELPFNNFPPLPSMDILLSGPPELMPGFGYMGYQQEEQQNPIDDSIYGPSSSGQQVSKSEDVNTVELDGFFDELPDVLPDAFYWESSPNS